MEDASVLVSIIWVAYFCVTMMLREGKLVLSYTARLESGSVTYLYGSASVPHVAATLFRLVLLVP